MFVGSAQAEQVVDFERTENSLQLRYDRARTRLLGHRRTRVAHSGTRSEHVEFVVGSGGGRVWLEHQLEPSRVNDELELSLWLKGNRPGAALGLRVILPHHVDPRTKAVLSTFVAGTAYTDTGRWQNLGCRDVDAALRERIRHLRWKLSDPTISDRDAYVDRVVIQADTSEGAVEFFVDDLRFGPIVDPRAEAKVLQASRTRETVSPIDFRLDQLRVDGRPFLPRFTPYHGEELGELDAAGLNTVLVPRHDDAELLQALRRAGLWAMATPPRPLDTEGRSLDRATASLLPFGPESDPILLWLAGTRVPGSKRDEVAAWASQVRAADRLDRPMLADVAADERGFSRDVRMLGVSRHFVNGTMSTRAYHDWLRERSRRAWPGTFLWTWIQTEPNKAHERARSGAGLRPVVLEPEQIRLQVYTALSAGCRGIGYWKTTPLDGTRPGDQERRLAIRQLDLELQLLEPLLATSGLAGSVPFTMNRPTSEVDRGDLDFRTGRDRTRRENLLRVLAEQRRNETLEQDRFDAAMLRTSAGLVLLPVWHERGSQFVPGQMAASDARVLLTGASETATAWEVTTTSIRSLGRGEPVPGGRQIVLPKFDQTAVILVTADRKVVERLRRTVAEIAESSSETAIALARAKFARVERTSTELRAAGHSQPDAPQLLGRARSMLLRAESIHSEGGHDAARELAADAMQALRILQRADWEAAVGFLASPAASPHALCHNTLPDHWRMIERIGRSPYTAGENLLHSGDFEDLDTMLVEGWTNRQRERPDLQTTTELVPDGHGGKYALRLAVEPVEEDEEEAGLPPDRSITLTTPAVPVAGGQMVHLSGWYRHRPRGKRHVDGPVVYDNVLGSSAALRLDRLPGGDESGWKRFELIREVHRSRDVSMTFVMNGHGELLLDDVRVVVLEERGRPNRSGAPQRLLPGNPLNLINRLPGLPGFGRESSP